MNRSSAVGSAAAPKAASTCPQRGPRALLARAAISARRHAPDGTPVADGPAVPRSLGQRLAGVGPPAVAAGARVVRSESRESICRTTVSPSDHCWSDSQLLDVLWRARLSMLAFASFVAAVRNELRRRDGDPRTQDYCRRIGCTAPLTLRRQRSRRSATVCSPGACPQARGSASRLRLRPMRASALPRGRAASAARRLAELGDSQHSSGPATVARRLQPPPPTASYPGGSRLHLDVLRSSVKARRQRLYDGSPTRRTKRRIPCADDERRAARGSDFSRPLRTRRSSRLGPRRTPSVRAGSLGESRLDARGYRTTCGSLRARKRRSAPPSRSRRAPAARRPRVRLATSSAIDFLGSVTGTPSRKSGAKTGASVPATPMRRFIWRLRTTAAPCSVP